MNHKQLEVCVCTYALLRVKPRNELRNVHEVLCIHAAIGQKMHLEITSNCGLLVYLLVQPMTHSRSSGPFTGSMDGV